MKIENIIGVDISKKTIDLVAHSNKSHLLINNDRSGFKEFEKWTTKHKIDLLHTMIVMEHTGLYSRSFECFLHAREIAFTKVSSLAIKRSLGIIRGKNDHVDAARIAVFGFEKRSSLQADVKVEYHLERLKMLHTTREKFVRQRAGLICAVQEYKHIGLSDKDLIVTSQAKVIKMMDEQIDSIEKEMEALVKTNESSSRNYRLLQSIKGVGPVVAMAAIIRTNNFTRFISGRKFSCFCGTAPFEHTSGTSIKGRTKVSHIADKKMKTLLDLAAKTAMQHDPELKEYYERRVKMGKPKMSTINIIRNKIIFRMFAVIKRQTPFEQNYLNVA